MKVVPTPKPFGKRDSWPTLGVDPRLPAKREAAHKRERKGSQPEITPEDQTEEQLASTRSKREISSPSSVAIAVRAADGQLDKQLVPFDQLSQRQKRTKKAEFMRTLKGEHDANDKRQEKKCPPDVRDTIAANPNKYFKQWYEANGNYKELKVEVRASVHQEVTHIGKRKWMREDEIYAMFPKEVAEAKMAHLRGTKHHKKDPQAPTCKTAEMYHIIIVDEDEDNHKRTRSMDISGSKEPTTEDEVKSQTALLDGCFHYIDNGLDRKRSDPPSPAPLTEEQKRAKEEAAKLKKEQLEAKKADPIEQAKSYMRKLPLDVTETTRLLLQIASQKVVPKNLAAEYTKMFSEHNKKLQKAITDLQSWLADPRQADGATVIKKISNSAENFRMDKKSWESLYNQHAKPQEGKGKDRAMKK